jgi:hypothetical protein
MNQSIKAGMIKDSTPKERARNVIFRRRERLQRGHDRSHYSLEGNESQ